MPLYEYQCQECENRFERIEKASTLHDGVCPECGGPAHRLLGAPALKFKGSGWYVTDYGKGNGSSPASNDSRPTEKSVESSSSTDASETTTPAPKADSKVA
jgi:putative FmdB family regulatory protein